MDYLEQQDIYPDIQSSLTPNSLTGLHGCFRMDFTLYINLHRSFSETSDKIEKQDEKQSISDQRNHCINAIIWKFAIHQRTVWENNCAKKLKLSCKEWRKNITFEQCLYNSLNQKQIEFQRPWSFQHQILKNQTKSSSFCSSII